MSGAEKINAKVSNIIKLNDLVTRFEFERTDGQLFPKGITEDVISDPFVCSHCGLNLFVRDHYSRRLAAFQGVCIDAEDPGNIPDSVELYK